MNDLQPWQWAVGVLAALLAGMAKTGVPGLGILVVPLMVLVVGDSRHGAGALLPLLCAADLFAAWWYRRQAAVGKLWELAPWLLLGMAFGAVVLARADDRMLRPLLGAIVLSMVALQAWRVWQQERRTEPALPPAGSLPAGPLPAGSLPAAAGYGVVGGFATTVANAAGPVMNTYLLRMGLPKAEFMGTGAWLFLVINFTKIPLFVAQDMITARTLQLDAVLIIVVVFGCLIGRWLFARLPQRGFTITVLTLAAAGGVLLLWPRG